MLIQFIELQNFRKLKSCRIDFDKKETVFVGSNNSGKTSAMDALIMFLKTHDLTTREFTLSNWLSINEIGTKWLETEVGKLPDLTLERWLPFVPQLDVWLNVTDQEYHYVSQLIPTLGWQGGLLGVRFSFQPKSVEALYKEYISAHQSAVKISASSKKTSGQKLSLWPKSLWDFLERRLKNHFNIECYLLDANKLMEPIDGLARPQATSTKQLPITGDPFKGLIKIDIINAQRGFTDPNSGGADAPKAAANLSGQLREYYVKHLNPIELPEVEDVEALEAIEDARSSFDDKLKKSFEPSLKELEELNYPGFGGNPSIRIASKVSAIDGLNHESAVTFELFQSADKSKSFPLSLPEKYNGLGYQNLISMVFKLIRFRDEWLQVGKVALASSLTLQEVEFQPLHLVLVEEPEAHLHAQVQQVFIRKAYDVLRRSDLLNKHKHFSTQLVVSTHSNHIAHEIQFTSLRYFKRKPAANKNDVPFSTVVNLSKTFGTETETTKFAVRYLKTTHCDLFFADAVILLEGPAEKMLVPYFIRNHYPELDVCYISLLEIGGSHAHTLQPLLEDLGIITLIITDLDSIDPATGKAEIPIMGKGLVTGNTTIKKWLPKLPDIDSLVKANEAVKLSSNFPVRVAYQQAINIKVNNNNNEVVPYTFEIALALENLNIFKTIAGTGLIAKFKDATNLPTITEANKAMFEALKNGKKAEFALELLFREEPKKLATPTYIAQGLDWLKTQLATRPKTIA